MGSLVGYTVPTRMVFAAYAVRGAWVARTDSMCAMAVMVSAHIVGLPHNAGSNEVCDAYGRVVQFCNQQDAVREVECGILNME